MKIDKLIHSAHRPREGHHHQPKANKLARLVRQAGAPYAGYYQQSLDKIGNLGKNP